MTGEASSVLLALALWRIPRECACPRCSTHESERQRRRERQRELAHEVQHRGYGWGPGDPDRFRCSDELCPRNAERDDSTQGVDRR